METTASLIDLRLRDKLHRLQRDTRVCRVELGDRIRHGAESSIRIEFDDADRPQSVHIARRAHSYFPIFLGVVDSESLVIADTMGFMHDVITGDDSELTNEAQLQHLIFGRTPPEGLLSSIQVVDHGETVVLENGDGGWSVVRRRRDDCFEHGGATSWREDREGFSGRLEAVTGSISPQSMLFSGGVDSTLLRANLASDVEMISGRVPDREFADEVEQAARAAKLFDAPHRYVDVGHDEFVDRLAELTRTTGQPCPALQHVLQTRVVARAKSVACYGELGDGTFGLPMAADSGLRRRIRSVDGDMANAASRCFSLASMRDEDQSFHSALNAVYGDVEDVHHRRARRTRELVGWSDKWNRRAENWERFLVYGHAIDFLTVGCVKCVRDFAAAHGVVVHTPYTDRKLMDRFHRYAPSTRYFDEGRTKPVLKTALSAALPDYPVNRSKLASSLPRTWYFTDGPLGDVFERYPPPAPMSRAVKEAVDEPKWQNSWILWPVLSYSVWYHEWFCAASVPRRADRVDYRFGTASQSPSKIAS